MANQSLFITTRAFEKATKGLFTAKQVTGLKMKLAMNPELGDLIPRTGGARKVRHVGERGQSRVIYYYHLGADEIFFLTCYSKNVKDNLTTTETKLLAAIVKDIIEAKR